MDIQNSSIFPINIFQPFNITVFFSIFSPIILATSILSLSFIFQNFKGLVYLGFLIGVCVLRIFFYWVSGSSSLTNNDDFCSKVQYSAYGNSTFSLFVFAFTITYLSIPMFINNSVNFPTFLGLLVYFLLDIFIKIYKKCIISSSDMILNILCGAISAGIIITLMSSTSSQYLFFNEISSSKEICSMPKKQTFKCAVYKNGTLISENVS